MEFEKVKENDDGEKSVCSDEVGDKGMIKHRMFPAENSVISDEVGDNKKSSETKEKQDDVNAVWTIVSHSKNKYQSRNVVDVGAGDKIKLLRGSKRDEQNSSNSKHVKINKVPESFSSDIDSKIEEAKKEYKLLVDKLEELSKQLKDKLRSFGQSIDSRKKLS